MPEKYRAKGVFVNVLNFFTDFSRINSRFSGWSLADYVRFSIINTGNIPTAIVKARFCNDQDILRALCMMVIERDINLQSPFH
jgi:hypothetical protein